MARGASLTRSAVVVGLLFVPLLLASQAQARVFIGFGFPLYYGPPAYYPPPPVYYPPPAYYPPPQAYYPPPQTYAPQATGQTCYASGYTCPMDHPVAPGSSCFCTTAQGRVWGNSN